MSLIDLPGEHRMVLNPLHLVLGEQIRSGQTDIHMLTNLTRTLDPDQAAKFWRRVERIDRASWDEGGEPGGLDSRDLAPRSTLEAMPPGPPGESAPSAGTAPASRRG